MSMLLLLCAAAHGLLAGGTCQPTARRAALSLSLLTAASTWDDETLGGLSGAMHLAIRCGDAARVRELLDEACASGDAHSRAALLQPGAVGAGGPLASARAGAWASALHLAAQYDQAMLVPLLLEAGASTAARDGGSGDASAGDGRGGGATPLMVAAAHGSSRAAAALLAAGADRQATSAAGSVVHVAAVHGSVGVLRLLWDDARTISALSAPGPGGWPPLHAAAINGEDGAARELIRLGADRALLAHGQTALDVATSDDVRRALLYDGGIEGRLAARASPLVAVSLVRVGEGEREGEGEGEG